MNIAVFTDSYYPRINGVTISVSSYADELCKMGHKVIIVCPEYTSDVKNYFKRKCHYEHFSKQLPGVAVLRVPADKNPFSKEDRAGRIDQWHRLKKELDKFKPNVIHINSEFLIGYYGLIYARHRHIANVYTFHTLWEDYFENYATLAPKALSQKVGKELVRFYLKRSYRIIVPTTRIQNVVGEYGITRPTHILPTGISDSVSQCNAAKLKSFKAKLFKKYPVLKDKKILLYTGRVVIEKNLSFLLKVFDKINAEMPDTALLIVGGGPGLEIFPEEAKSLASKDSIIFTGYQERADLTYFYRVAKLFVFPSVTETQGLVTIEAMMNMLPVVAIGEMGTVDVMNGDNGGFMVKNDFDDFYSKTKLLLTDENLWNSKSKEAVEWSSKWRMPNLTKTLIQTYIDAINDGKEYTL